MEVQWKGGNENIQHLKAPPIAQRRYEIAVADFL
jgi:hypothetical protein